jgi:hypothetical protein
MNTDEMFDEAERRELVNDALRELDAIMEGGQNTNEFVDSCYIIKEALEASQ